MVHLFATTRKMSEVHILLLYVAGGALNPVVNCHFPIKVVIQGGSKPPIFTISHQHPRKWNYLNLLIPAVISCYIKCHLSINALTKQTHDIFLGQILFNPIIRFLNPAKSFYIPLNTHDFLFKPIYIPSRMSVKIPVGHSWMP